MNITLDQWAGVALGQVWVWQWCVCQDRLAFAAIAGMLAVLIHGEFIGQPFEIYKEL